jgi:hypothetical protein
VSKRFRRLEDLFSRIAEMKRDKAKIEQAGRIPPKTA